MKLHPVAAMAWIAALAACGTKDGAEAATGTELAVTEPDLDRCPEEQPYDDELMERTGPIPVPKEFAGLMKSGMSRLAVGAAAGNALCIDASYIETIEEPTLSDDKRFLGFSWLGYETYGHYVVDRSGRGQIVDTGNTPAYSPSGRRLAAVDLSESGFGSLNAFAVWQVDPIGIKELANTYDGLPSGDWRIEGWAGEDCVKLGLLPSDRQPEDYADFDTAPRDPWFAAQKNGWIPAEGHCPKA